MIKILQVLPTLNLCGGVENYLMNYYRHMDDDVCHFDFAVHAIDDRKFQSEIEGRGGKIYRLSPFTVKNFPEIQREIKQIFEREKYDIVHCHQANAALFYFSKAKKAGVGHRILHSHQAAAADKILHKLRNRPLLALGKKYATDYFACSKLAGDYLYGKAPYTIVNNAVETEKFAFRESDRREIRQRLSIPEDCFVVGHVGRMCAQKNQSFLVEIFAQISERREHSKLILVGDGEQRGMLEEKVRRLGLEEKVIFVGKTSETEKYYAAMDVFLLPSLYEGLPVVGVEAQCSGLKVLLSDRVTRETKLLESTQFLPLNDAALWAERALSATCDRADASEIVKKKGYDIITESKRLEKLYCDLI